MRLLAGADEGLAPRRIMRALGVRHVLQATAEQVLGKNTVRIGVWVDGLHALSCFGFACLNARWRRCALADGAITSGFAALGRMESVPR